MAGFGGDEKKGNGEKKSWEKRGVRGEKGEGGGWGKEVGSGGAG